MVFNSVVFLFCFLPLSLLLYYLVPGRAKNAVLLAESLIFYCWTGVAFLPLIAVLIVFNYLWALLTARAKAKLRGLLPLAAVLVNLGVLVYFKYANFLIDTVNQVAHLGLAALNIGTVLPLGISYYIFKIISYEVDVCTGKIAPEKNFITFAVYVLFFPQLIVGPIVKYREMADQLHDGANRCTPARAEHGAELFVFGLAKKVILADSIGALWTDIIGAGGVGLTNVSTPLAWLGIIAYSLQLYFDFAGYSEMSNGLAALLGQLQPAVYLGQHHRVLAALAYYAVGLVPGLYLHSPGRQPQGPGAPAAQYVPGLGCYRHLARGQLELYCLGPLLLCAAHD